MKNKPTHPPAMPPKIASARRILLLEDDAIIRFLSAEVLRRGGYQVDPVESAQAAWKILQTDNFDLLITDDQMPGLSGSELVRKLRDAQMSLPVIFASGGLGAVELSRSLWSQPAVALPKPYTAGQLLDLVAQTLPVRHNRRPEITIKETGDLHDHTGINE